jgi:hypothetical protein
MRPMETSKTRLVSVATPEHDAAEFIGCPVKSCFNQRFRPLEITVVKDGSADSTLDTVDHTSRSTPDKVILRAQKVQLLAEFLHSLSSHARTHGDDIWVRNIYTTICRIIFDGWSMVISTFCEV